MSYTISNLFCVSDKNLQSYYMETENDTIHNHSHGHICNGNYKITCPGARHILKTPALSTFSLTHQIMFDRPFYTHTHWAILFGYDKRYRRGHRIAFQYFPGNKNLTVSLEAIDSLHCSRIESQTRNVNLEVDIFHNVSIEISSTTCSISIANTSFSFSLNGVSAGAVGFECLEVMSSIYLKDVMLSSDDALDSQIVLPPVSVTIPAINGNVYPYTLTLSVFRYEDSDYDELFYTLSGGLSQREDKELNADFYSFSDEFMNDPFIRINNVSKSEKIYLWNNRGVMMDPATPLITREFYQIQEKDIRLPLTSRIPIHRISNEALLSFGYQFTKALGACAHGGEHEFLFDRNGKIIWDGALLDNKFVCEVKSNQNKRIVSMIPTDIPRYEEAVAHASGNHYFFDDEPIDFTLHLITAYNPAHINVQARIDTIYGDLVSKLAPTSLIGFDFSISNLNQLLLSVSAGTLPLGVYHVVFDILIADQVVYTHTSAFEVFSTTSEQSPQEAAGLPHIHCGDGAPMGLMTATPDPWSVLRDESFIHYIDHALFDPIFSENSQVWRLLKLYRRKWAVWLVPRTLGTRNIYEFPNCLTYADYVYLPFPKIEESPNAVRYDLWRHSVYTSAVLEALKDFLNANPDLSSKLQFGDVTKEFTKEMLNKLFDTCAAQWIEYIDTKIAQWYAEQLDMLKDYNPNMKRFSYGPFSVYGSAYTSGYFMKFDGIEYEKAHLNMNGFYQLEDYPFWCAYNCASGAWTLNTIKLYAPNLVIRPELYGNIETACPDGFVGWAHPPAKQRYFPAYTLGSQILEYVFNSAHFSNGSMEYWNNYGFMWLQYGESNNKERMSALLKTWRQIRNCQPKNPVRSVVFVADFIGEEDQLAHDIHHDAVFNHSEANVSYLNLVCRESGIPVGCATKFSGLLDLDASQIDTLVLPSLKHASADVLRKIEDLYQQGVSLFAVSDVSGLEHIFGVETAPDNCIVSQFSNETETENLLPIQAPFRYRATAAKVLLQADDGRPVLTCNNRAALLNTCVSRAGVDMCNPSTIGRHNVSKLLKAGCTEIFRSISNPVAYTSTNNGLVLFEGKDGHTYLMATAYYLWEANDFDWNETRELLINFNMEVKKLIAIDNEEVITCAAQEKQTSLARILVHPFEARLFRLEM